MGQQAAIANRAYRNARLTLPPLPAIVALYQTCIAQIMKARDARVANRRDEEFAMNVKAILILQGLKSNLDRSTPALQDMSGNLSAFYDRTVAQIHMAQRLRGQDSLDRYDSLHRQLLEMLEAWKLVLATVDSRGSTSSGQMAGPAAGRRRDA